MAKLVLALAVVGIATAVWWTCNSCHPKVKPVLNQNEWWGPDELRGKHDNSIKPFQVRFSDQMVQDLKQRLKNHRPWTPPLDNVGFEYGFNSKQLDTWTSYWANKYNFTERERFFNKYPQFTTNIQGLDIHYIRVKPHAPSVEVVPLLLLHGWPGSVREFYEAIPLLTTQTPGFNFVFEVIVPSLPGYGFSSPAVRPGLGAPQVAVVLKNLMTRLGYNKFYVQGGDWGSLIGSILATAYPEDVLGYHSNMAVEQSPCSIVKMIIGSFYPSLVVEPHLADRMFPLSKIFSYAMEEFGYFHIQATKPDTIGVGLSDSPAGLLAYILEKFSTWTNSGFRSTPDGKLEFRFTKDQLIDNLMVYWSTNSITTSMRLYAESMSKEIRGIGIAEYPTPVPTWVFQAKHELFYSPPSFLKKKYTNLLNTTVLDDGGHFLALELPQTFAHDLFKAVKAFKEWHLKAAKSEL